MSVEPRAGSGSSNPGEPAGSAPAATSRCPACGAENPVGKRFCGDCASPLARLYPFDPKHLAMLTFLPAFADWLTGTQDHLDVTADRAKLQLKSTRRVPWTDCWAQAGLGLIAVIRHDAAAAERAYGALSHLTGCLADLPLVIDDLLGMFAATMGRDEAAIGHFDAALASCARAGYRPAYGWAAADYAALLLDRGDPADHPRAVALGNEALAIGRELGMRPLVERVLARREFLTA